MMEDSNAKGAKEERKDAPSATHAISAPFRGKPPPKIAESQGPRMAFGLTADRSRASRGTPVHTPDLQPNNQQSTTGNRSAMHSPSSMHTRLRHPEQYKPGPDTRLNPSGPRLKLSSERKAERDAADIRAGRKLRDAGEPMMRGDFERMFWLHFPESLRPADWNRYGQGNAPSPGSALVINSDGDAVKWGTASGISAVSSFACSIKDDTTVTVQKGVCYYADKPGQDIGETDVPCTDTGFIYIQLEILTGAWTGPLFSATDPDVNQDADTSIWTLCEVTVAADVITTLFQRWTGDIFESRA